MENKDEIQIASVSESEVPSLIQEQFTKMTNYKNKLSIARQKAEKANQQARELRDSKTKLFKMKTKLEDIQETQLALAEATLENTEAQELSFEYQRVLAEISKYLFGLGVTNIAVNRCVVKELKMRIEEASEEEIDNMAREELLNVVKELKEQEDVIQKQNELNEKQKKAFAELSELDNKINEISDELKRIREEKRYLTEELIKTKKFNLYIAIAAFLVSLIALVLILIKFFS